MADPSTYRPATGEIPNQPGVYRFRDKDRRVIYVGKAKNLRSRLTSYFQDITALHPRTATMVRTGASVEWTVVGTEVEALQLEYAWIKEYDPRFNVRYRDDKSYPYLAVTMGEEFPRAMVLRGAKRKSTRYFGPYAHAWAIRETLDLAMRVFPMRTCSAGVFRRAGQVGRPCLLGYIDKCSAPCVGRVDAEHHRAIAEEFCDFMAGESARFVTRLTAQMRAASAALEFEQAARIRDDLGALNRVLERSAVVLPDATDADVFGLAEDELEVAVQVFHVRGGRVRGQRGWVAERDAESTAEVVAGLVQRFYGGQEPEDIPKEVLVPFLPEDHVAVASWLTDLRGSSVDLRVPRRGDKRTLMETVEHNATQSLARHKVARAGDLTARSQAMQELQDHLDLDGAPLRIECYDISHIQGAHPVGSMVVFEDGIARKSEYRSFIIRSAEAAGPEGVDDSAAMREVLTRRFRRARAEEDREDSEGSEGREGREGRKDSENSENSENSEDLGTQTTSRAARFAYPPQLLVVDGGLPQVTSAAEVLADLGIVDLPVIGLAKRLEEVWVPGQEFPLVLPRTSEGLYLLQRVRDEAHRFANTFHRKRRSKAMTASRLDGIAGLGDAKRAALLAHFGSVKRIRLASEDELTEVRGIGPALARVIRAELGAQSAPEPAVNLSTGEVLDDGDSR